MFVCNECKKEYSDKPQYCDCGNDTFEEIITEKPKTDYLKKYNVSPFALSFFVICIVASILVLLFFPKIKDQTEQENTSQKVVKPITYNIPDIDSFWVNPAPVVEEEIVEVEIIQPVKKVTTAQPVAKPVVKQPQKPIVEETTKQQTTKTKPKTNNISKSLAVTNYKIALRQKLFTNLSVVSIQGNGKCGIEFSIDANGKLINRAFTFQSDNKSVNDEVYKMLMRTPTFNPPPQEYKGEKIKMIFLFEEGSFEISFVN